MKTSDRRTRRAPPGGARPPRPGRSTERGRRPRPSGAPARERPTGPRPAAELPPGPERLRQIFHRCGLRLAETQVQQFWAFHQLLRSHNLDSDLTRLHAFDTIVLKHYVDCALVATLVDLPSPLLDLGSGAGFPGIPLKIVRPDVHILLGEPRGKRAAFLEEAVRVLDLRDVEVVSHRIGPRFDRPVRGVITRAVESIPATLGRVAPWLAPGARVLFMKGPAADAEVEAARRDWAPSFQVLRDVPYSIPTTPHERRLVVVERLAAPAAETAADAATDRREGTTTDREQREIASAANPTFKLLRAALAGRGIRKHGQALLAGIHPVLEVLRDFPERSHAWITAGSTPAPPADAPATLAWYRLLPSLFREIDAFGTGGPLLLVDVPALEPWEDTDWPIGCTLFVPFQDPENVGAVLRTAAAFGVARAVLLQEAAHPFHPRSARAAGSALLRLRLLRGPSIRALAPRGAPVFALSPSGRDVGHFTFPDRFGLLPGVEGPGLPDAWRTAEALAIPMQPGNESLNAAAATAIVLYLWSRGAGDAR